MTLLLPDVRCAPIPVDGGSGDLKALEKNTAAGDPRAKLTERLAADSSRLDAGSNRRPREC